MVWTQFWDMSSGGGRKHKFDHAFIEAPAEEAKCIFYARFGTNPERVSCTCCGSDYSVSEYATIDEATEYHRRINHRWGSGKEADIEHKPVDEYLKQDDVAVVFAADIKPEERSQHVPEQGYVWQD